MIQEPTLEFPAIRARKQGRQQYIANWSLKTVIFCLGLQAKDARSGSGLRLNHAKTRKLAKEWIGEGSHPPYSPLIVTIEKGCEFVPYEGMPDIGFGTLSMPLSKIIDVTDGIHRIAALRQVGLSAKFPVETEWPIEFIECADREDAIRLTERLRTGLGI